MNLDTPNIHRTEPQTTNEDPTLEEGPTKQAVQGKTIHEVILPPRHPNCLIYFSQEIKRQLQHARADRVILLGRLMSFWSPPKIDMVFKIIIRCVMNHY